MKNILYSIPILIVLMSFLKKDEVYIQFPNEIGIIENCGENETSIKFNLETDSKKKIQIHNFNFNNQNFTLVVNGEKKYITDTLYVSKKNPLCIEIKFIRSLNSDQDDIRFKTNENKYQYNKIRIKYGEYNINSESVRNGEEQIFNFTESCNDSLIIHFPYGGTVSGVSIFKDSTKLDSPIKSVSYGIMQEKNYLKFSKEEKDRYYVRFVACHWGNEFWLTIK